MRLTYCFRLFLTGIILIISMVRAGKEKNSEGEQLYGEYCSSCHGITGKGDGELEYLLYPKPRDFTTQSFKLRSTHSGVVPTHQDLVQTIKRGMPGTAMPSFYFLQDEEINALANHIKKLGNFVDDHPQSANIPDPLPYSKELVSLGKKVYSDLGCYQCHGELGKGDGPSAKSLKDTRGYPIAVRDFTQGAYLGGNQPEDLYLRFVTGMDGTPMPSYLGMIQEMGTKEQERQQLIWGLVYYVKSLETKEISEKEFLIPKDGKIQAAKVGNSLSLREFQSPGNPVWNEVPVYSIPLSRLWQKDQTNLMPVNVRVIYNKKIVGVMMEWEDDTKDNKMYRIQDFQDAAAVQFSLTGKPGFHGMGSRAHPANIWFWRAEWQMLIDQKEKPNIASVYPNRASDAEVSTYPSIMGEKMFLPGRDAESPVSSEQILSPTEDVRAAGPQTLTSYGVEDVEVTGQGIWDGKMWRVTFIREKKADRDDVRLKNSGEYPVAFAVWNGSDGDRNGQKMVSTWYMLELK